MSFTCVVKVMITICNRICEERLYTCIQFFNLKICNSVSIGPTALKFGRRTFLSLY